MTTDHRSLCVAQTIPLLLSGLLACTPLPTKLGDDLTGGDSDTAAGTGAESDSGEGLDPDGSEWSFMLPAETWVVSIATMADGGVTAIEHRQEQYEQRVTRYAADGTELWQVDIGSHSIGRLATLPDGALVVGGSVDDGGLRAAVWRLSSAGAVEATHVHPLPGDAQSNAHVQALAVSSDGMAYLVNNYGIEEGTPGSELWWVDLELEPQWSWTGFDGRADQVAVMPAGEIRSMEEGSMPGTRLLRGFTPEGVPAWNEVLPRPTRFANDDPLVYSEYSEELQATRVHGVEGTLALDFVIPSPPSAGGIIVTHRNGLATVGTVDFGHQLSVTQFDAAGVQLRELVRPPLALDLVAPQDLAIAPDGAIYISGFELTEPPGEPHGFLLKLPPPA